MTDLTGKRPHWRSYEDVRLRQRMNVFEKSGFREPDIYIYIYIYIYMLFMLGTHNILRIRFTGI